MNEMSELYCAHCGPDNRRDVDGSLIIDLGDGRLVFLCRLCANALRGVVLEQIISRSIANGYLLANDSRQRMRFTAREFERLSNGTPKAGQKHPD